jgi:hypothetical protein
MPLPDLLPLKGEDHLTNARRWAARRRSPLPDGPPRPRAYRDLPLQCFLEGPQCLRPEDAVGREAGRASRSDELAVDDSSGQAPVACVGVGARSSSATAARGHPLRRSTANILCSTPTFTLAPPRPARARARVGRRRAQPSRGRVAGASGLFYTATLDRACFRHVSRYLRLRGHQDYAIT